MTAQPLPALASGDPSAWDQALYAFLVEKGNGSGSRRTVESYSQDPRCILGPTARSAGCNRGRTASSAGGAVPDRGRAGRRERPGCG